MKKIILLAALQLSLRLAAEWLIPKANSSCGDTGLSPVSGWWVPPACSSGLEPAWDSGPAQDGAACSGRASLLPCPPQHPLPARMGNVHWPLPYFCNTGPGYWLPLSSGMPTSLCIFKPYPSAVPLWLLSPSFSIITACLSCHYRPTMGLLLLKRSLGFAKGVIGFTPPTPEQNQAIVQGLPGMEGGSGKKCSRCCFCHSLMQQHLIPAPRQLGPVVAAPFRGLVMSHVLLHWGCGTISTGYKALCSCW